MPLYSYTCKTHGEFRDWQTMGQSDVPMACPTCGRRAPRAISLPKLAVMNATNRKAHSINERSAHEPKVISKTPPTEPAGGHGHSHGRGRGHGHGHASRPWMIGH